MYHLFQATGLLALRVKLMEINSNGCFPIDRSLPLMMNLKVCFLEDLYGFNVFHTSQVLRPISCVFFI